MQAAHDIKKTKEDKPSHWGRNLLLLSLLVLIALNGYLGYLYFEHEQRIEQLLLDRQYFSTELASSTKSLALARTKIEDLGEEIIELEEELDETEDDLRDEKNRNEDFEDKLDDLAGTVGTLDRLSQLDEELLQKYSRVSFLNENYIPRKLTEINSRYVHEVAGDEYFLEDAYEFLEELMREARRDNIDIQIVSGYRSFEYQTELKGRYLVTYGEGANQFSADQGFSEHQLGTSVDFTTEELGGAMDERFASSEAYEWLLDNAHKYGFTLSYPEGNQFYVFEPWHWRFVGRDLARDLNREDAHFYDWEQRKINEYLISIFD